MNKHLRQILAPFSKWVIDFEKEPNSTGMYFPNTLDVLTDPPLYNALGSRILLTQSLKGEVTESGDLKPGGLHYPMLDLDFPVHLFPSSQEGHYHSIMEKPLSYDQYDKLIKVMTEVGLLNPCTYDRFKQRNQTRLRAPWVLKGDGDGGRPS